MKRGKELLLKMDPKYVTFRVRILQQIIFDRLCLLEAAAIQHNSLWAYLQRL